MVKNVVLRPDHLHVGSGRDFRNEALNVDINPHCHPDLVLDLSKPLEKNASYQTARFGNVALTPGSFAKITAFELLEHVEDLPRTMRNFLELLRDDGRLLLSVPYDLSHGAWQDPTHVRAFNERSWQYFTHNAWYLGWRDECFELERMLFTLDDGGVRLASKQVMRSRLTKTPRRIAGMRVILRKRKTTEAEKDFHDRMHQTIHQSPAPQWNLAGDFEERIENEFVRLADCPFSRCLVRLRLASVSCLYIASKLPGLGGVRQSLKSHRDYLRAILGIKWC